jgi:hypothetical protein
MNSQAVLNAIATYRSANAGNIPALIVINTAADTIGCHSFVELESSVDPEWRPVWINYTVLIDYYKDDIPVVLDTVNRTTVRDYLWTLLEYETRP